MRPTFAAQLNKMITAGLGGDVSAPETGVAVGRSPKYTSIGPAALLEFEANVALPFRALSVDMVPVQDLHGQDTPYPPGGGKNKFKMRATDGSSNGVTITANADGTVNVSGTATGGSTSISLVGNFPELAALFAAGGTFTLSMNKGTYDANAFNVSIGYKETSDGSTIVIIPRDNQRTKVVPAGSILQNCNLWVASGQAVPVLDNFALQLEVSSSATTFAPYSNICPITGYDEVNIWRDAEHDTTSEPEVTIQFDETVYGGTLDVVNGVLKDEWGIIASYTDEELPGEWISSIDVYSEGSSPSVGAQVCYKLAEPIETKLTAEQLSTLVGTNYVWSDGGNVSLTYTNVYFTEGY